MGQARANLVRNERIKLVSGFVNALAIGIIGIAVFKPVAEGAVESWWSLTGWSVIGLAMHGLSHYVLGYLIEEVQNGRL